MSPIVIEPIEAFHLLDNYIWVIRRADSSALWVLDPGDAQPVLDYLKARPFELAGILLTHHHPDHTGGVATLKALYQDLPVLGPAERLAHCVTEPLLPGQRVSLDALGVAFDVLDLKGHTTDQLGYLFDDGALFPGDALFSGGCGRLLGGTMAQLFDSIQRLSQLPDDTQVYCAHEYTVHNLRFALSVEPNNRALQARLAQVEALREQGLPSVPSSMGLERAINPFLRVTEPEIIASVQADITPDPDMPLAVFSALRLRRNRF